MSRVEAAKLVPHQPFRPEWLSLTREAIIDPERPIIDAHHHLWDKPGARYLRADLLEDVGSGHNVVATIFAEGRANYLSNGAPELRSLGETRLAADAAIGPEKAQLCAGIIGFVDLTLGAEAGPVLDRHVAAANGRFRGVRNTSAWHANPSARGSAVDCPPGLLQQPAFAEGLEQLARRNLVFDAWMYHTQLLDLVELARALPQLRIVINHQGGPLGIGPYAGRREAVFEDWSHAMARLAQFDNIHVKLGGFGMTMAGFDFHLRERPPTSDELSEAWGPYMRFCIDTFGAERCMFESNFPVDRGTTSYAVLWNAFKKIVSGASEQDKHALFYATAARVYALALPVEGT
ncbi:amidohydrolase family protein [Devosia sp.]|uniref:amidohydrolase family protein n=1 Tax=Devosia sp. TaxID=1871048 RepID=UPI002B001621|nr:amidohydrolase family protein [Devosia sp.]